VFFKLPVFCFVDLYFLQYYVLRYLLHFMLCKPVISTICAAGCCMYATLFLTAFAFLFHKLCVLSRWYIVNGRQPAVTKHL